MTKCTLRKNGNGWRTICIANGFPIGSAVQPGCMNVTKHLTN